jgi:alginate O-acetyltransferase complex protein AlgI
MLFLETWFWLFAAAAIPVYWVCPSPLKLYWLLLASGVFQYHFAGPAGMAPILVLAVLTYGTALLAPRGRGPGLGTAVVLVLVGALAFYKYSEFLLRNGGALLARAGLGTPAWVAVWRAPAIPLGISFFVFEFLHYLYEVRVTGREPIRNPMHFSLFALFFPTLAAGPIKRFPDFVPQLTGLRNPGPALAWAGAQRVIRGLFKKVCIADLMVEYVKVFERAPAFSGPIVVGLAVTQGFRIYYDFAGYSDIAIGLAQMLNLRVPENFMRPYWSTSLQEFWRRWHVSLSSWIRDYIYIPLGGNRAHRTLNLLAAMVLCGLWHGAAWHFAAWGVYHGVGLVVEGSARRWRPAWFGGGVGHRLVGWATCYAFVTYGWLLFFYPVHTVLDMTQGLLRWHFAS